MRDEIKELRTRIDGLAKLVKRLKPLEQFRLDVSSIPNNWDIETFIELQEKHIFVLENGIEKLPQEFREIEKSHDSLLMAKAWLGKVLGELGEDTPYKNDGKRKDIKDIEDASDVALTVAGLREPFTNEANKVPAVQPIDTWMLNGRSMSDYSNMNHIEKVDWLREEIKNIINNTDDFSKEYPKIELEQSFVYKYLSEARFWLGFELQRIKELENKE